MATRGSRGSRTRARRTRRSRRTTQAQRADRYRLYEAAVQDPPADLRFVDRVFRRHYGRTPRRLREDFCGTATLACHFVARHRDNHAWGIDLDPAPLAWGREHHVSKLTDDQRARLTLLQGNVLDTEHEPVDVIAAFNFSYFVFHERQQLLGYFEKSRARLRREGLLVLDLYGGGEAQRTQTETREYEGFDYVWDQDVFDPIHHRAVNHIHFEFPDGSRLHKAFTYDWRLWTIPELRDVLIEAGFRDVQAWWEQTDHETNEGNGVYYAAETARDDPAWVSYLVARR